MLAFLAGTTLGYTTTLSHPTPDSEWGAWGTTISLPIRVTPVEVRWHQAFPGHLGGEPPRHNHLVRDGDITIRRTGICSPYRHRHSPLVLRRRRQEGRHGEEAPSRAEEKLPNEAACCAPHPIPVSRKKQAKRADEGMSAVSPMEQKGLPTSPRSAWSQL